MCEISANTAEEMRDSVKLIQIIMFRQISHAIYHANCISDFSSKCIQKDRTGDYLSDAAVDTNVLRVPVMICQINFNV